MSLARQFAPHYTVADYQTWQGDWELWDGIAIAMTPSPFGRHQQVLVALVVAIANEIRKNQCPAHVLTNLDWIVSNDTVVRPDLMVLCGPVPERHLTSPPALVAEVLSYSTRSGDLGFKKQLYSQQGVPTYLIVDPEKLSVETWILNDSGDYEAAQAAAQLTIMLCQNCQIQINIQSLFDN